MNRKRDGVWSVMGLLLALMLFAAVADNIAGCVVRFSDSRREYQINLMREAIRRER